MDIKNPKLKLAGIALIAAGLIGLRECRKPDVVQVRKPIILKADETLRVSVRRNEIQIARRDRPDVLTDTRRVDISVKDDGRVVITERKYGFTFEPGFGFAVTDKAGIALNVQVAYYKSFGLDLGAAYLPRERLEQAFRPYVAISYGLPFRLTQNTSVFAGVTVQKDPIVGIKVRF